MASVQIHVTLEGFSKIDFDKKKIRKVMRRIGRDARNDARRLVAREAILMPIGTSASFVYEGSKAGQNPFKNTGKLQESITEKVSRSGFMVDVAPRNKAFGGRKNYYPGMLYYGVKGRIAPRNNYVVDAVENRRAISEAAIFSALKESFKSANEF